MQQVLREKLATYGQWTYRGAWALEISAAALGLTTGIALAYQAFRSDDAGSVTSMDLVLASAPFIMVAIAELTKIPIATLLFSASWRWRPVIFVFLAALALITFETVFMGLERAATLRQLRYEETVKEIKALEFQRDQIDRRLADAGATDQLKKAEIELQSVGKNADEARKKIRAQIVDVEKEFEGPKFLSPSASRIRDNIREKVAERDRLLGERDGSIRTAVEEFQRQRDSFTARITSARSANDLETVRRYEDEVRRLVNPRPRIEQQYVSRITLLDADLSTLRLEFERAQADAAPMTPVERQGIERRRDELRNQAEKIDREWEERRVAAQRQFEAAQGIEANKSADALRERADKDEISRRLTALEARRVESARTDQVRRIAARFYGLRPETVTDDQAGFISVVWFGSLAALAALAGPLTAIVALSLQKIAAGQDAPARPTKLARLIRRILLNWRWKRVRNIFVPVEVPVDREVEKRIEVPVERVVKEILYVPVLTDDPEAVRRAVSDGLPKDIAELVSISIAGAGNASTPQHDTSRAGDRPRGPAGVNTRAAG